MINRSLTSLPSEPELRFNLNSHFMSNYTEKRRSLEAMFPLIAIPNWNCISRRAVAFAR